MRQFVQEARAASALNHPNILTIHEIGQADGVHFIATEFVKGHTLRHRLSQKAMELPDALRIQRAVRPHEAVVAAKQLQIIFETLLRSRAAYRPLKKIGRDFRSEVQPFDEVKNPVGYFFTAMNAIRRDPKANVLV